jgi:putative ABC transport system permease protein
MSRASRRGWGARQSIAFTIAWRSSVRSAGRSALIVLLIAVPIAGMSGVVVLASSMQATTSERLASQLGKSQAVLRAVSPPNVPIRQNPLNADVWRPANNTEHSTTDPFVAPDAYLTPGVRLLPVYSANATVTTADGVASLTTFEGTVWDPSLSGHFDLTHGRAPRTETEILVSAAGLSRLGVTLGGTVHVRAPVEQDLTVVGILEDRRFPASQTLLFGEPGTFFPTNRPTRAAQTDFYLIDHPLNWGQVKELNTHGFTAMSREVLLNPPPPGEGVADYNTSPLQSVLPFAAILAAFALFEIVLLAGAAFAVNARQQQRTLAIVASVGANRSTLFSVLSSTGVVLGFIGGVLGTLLGVGGAAGFMAITDDGSRTQYPGFHLNWAILAGVVIFATVIGWIASLTAAAAWSKLDVVGALRGARRPPATTRRRPVAGTIILALGLLCTLAGGIALVAILAAGHTTQGKGGTIGITLIIIGPLLAQIGLALCGPIILRIIARAASRGGLAARLATRDAARNPGRTVPAFGAILTTVFVAVFAMNTISSAQALQDASYQWSTGKGQVASRVLYYDPSTQKTAHVSDPSRLEDAIRSTLDVKTVRTLSSVPDIVDPGTPSGAQIPTLVVPPPNLCPNDSSSPSYSSAYQNPASAQSRSLKTDPRCNTDLTLSTSSSWYGHIWVGNAADLALVLGHTPSDQSTSTLSSGGAVSLHRAYVRQGKLTINWWSAKRINAGEPYWGKTTPQRSKTLAATIEETTQPIPFGIFISRATATTLGISPEPSIVLASLATPATNSQLDAARQATSIITGASLGDSVTIENGPTPSGQLIAWWLLALTGLMTIAAAAIAIGLARFDGRADDATLASVGAPNSTRRRFAFWQALVICSLGSVLGGALGILPALAMGLPGGPLPFSPPWMQIILAALALPVVIAAGSWLLAGRTPETARRLAIS